jgi:AcrR family transcriptional regulator
LPDARRRLSGEERRHRLLTCAHELFGKAGYRGTEVDDIAHRAGVTKPVLYRHFPGGKAEIFLAVLEEHMNALMRVLWEALASSTEPRRRLHHGLDAYIGFAEANTAGFRLLTQTAGDFDPAVAQRLNDFRQLIVRGLSNTIADVMKGAGLPSEAAPLDAHAMLGGAESVTSWWLSQASKPPRDVIVDHLLAFMWRGFDGLPRHPSRYHHDLGPRPAVAGPKDSGRAPRPPSSGRSRAPASG